MEEYEIDDDDMCPFCLDTGWKWNNHIKDYEPCDHEHDTHKPEVSDETSTES